MAPAMEKLFVAVEESVNVLVALLSTPVAFVGVVKLFPKIAAPELLLFSVKSPEPLDMRKAPLTVVPLVDDDENEPEPVAMVQVPVTLSGAATLLMVRTPPPEFIATLPAT